MVAGAAVLAWALLLGVFILATRNRDVEPGPATLDLGGSEPPAVVNLVTNDWRLGREALPATLLDLAARKMVDIDQVGERTLVRVGPASGRVPESATGLEPYERMVLDHVVALATDGVIPAEALTTGPEAEAKGWWKSFRKSVERDARDRGLSRRRWSPAARATLTVTALAVTAVVGVASTTLTDLPTKSSSSGKSGSSGKSSSSSDDDPIGVALGIALLTSGALLWAAEVPNGPRDTPAGRDAAGRWLGLRALLSEDPLFAEYPPAGVALWDRLLSYGAAMGVAHGAVRALPFGAERDDEAWSPVGGQWRVVRVRYPWRIPPGYGRHPLKVALIGLFQVAVAVVALPAATAAADALRDLVTDSSADRTLPAGFDSGAGIALTAVLAIAVLIVVHGLAMAVGGISDLVSGRQRVEGRVLRVRRRGSDDKPRWYVAVDHDGRSGRVRAWRTSPAGAVQGATVGANVTRSFAHVRDLEVLAPAPTRPSLPDAGDEEQDTSSLAYLLGRVDTDASPSSSPLPAVSGPPPPLPDAEAVSAATGRSWVLDATATTHPLAQDGRSAAYVGADGARLQVAWVDPTLLQAHRSMPRFLRRALPGVGDEAYRAAIGGGVVARRNGHVLVVMGHLPGVGDADRSRAFEAVARAAMDASGDRD